MKTHCNKHDLPMSRAKKCTRCNAEAVQRRRDKIKRMAIEYKGGKCSVCGFEGCPAVFDFHHLDPTKKEFGIGGQGHTRSWKRVQTELDKCILVCANCHREIEYCIPE